MAKGEKKSWIATIHCEIIKEVVLEDCTEKQANEDPWDHAIDEREVEQVDWRIESLKENV
jgi:hypothetical protein